MTHVMRNLTTATAALLFASCQTETNPTDTAEEALRNGTAASNMEDRVFRIYTDQQNYATGTMVKYPRCILTSRHNEPVVKIADRRDDSQRVARTEALGQPADWGFNDLRIIYTEAKTGYRKLEFDAHPLSFGRPLLNIIRTVPVVDFPHDPGFRMPIALEGDEVSIYGYGWADSSFHHQVGPLRHGRMLISGKADGSTVLPQVTGTVLALQADNGIGTCPGDSGSPIFQAGDLVAVLTGGTNDLCRQNTTNTGAYTHRGEVSHATALVGDNKGWVEETIERLCGKLVSVSTEGYGHVEGDLFGADGPPYADATINQTVYCDAGDSDCSEMVHHGQWLRLRAVHDEGAEFIEWVGDSCPCHGTDDPTCVVKEDEIGTYSATESVDAAGCHAVFTNWIIEDDCGYEQFLDDDGDGFGDPSTASWDCTGGDGNWVDQGGDCDDGDSQIYPWAIELCDGLDNDCNGSVDDYCYDEDGGYSDPYSGDTYEQQSTDVEGCEDVAEDPAMCTDDGTTEEDDGGADDAATEDTYTEEPPESSDPSMSSGATLWLSCGNYSVEVTDDGGAFWVPLTDGSMAEGYTSGGMDYWCAPGAFVDASDWGDGTDYWSDGSSYAQGGLTAPYCSGGETTSDEACANAY